MGSFDNWAHREIKRAQARRKRAEAAKKKANKAATDQTPKNEPTEKKNINLSADQFTDNKPVETEPETPPKPDMDEHGGELPERVEHDSGRGTKIEYPRLACSVEGCQAKFFSFSKRDAHLEERHK